MSSLINVSPRAVGLLVCALFCAGCSGDELPSLDRLGALRTTGDEVTIRFEGCPGERIERVVLNLTDDDFEEIEQVLWEIRADGGGSSADSLIVGDAGGLREVTALDAPLEADDHVQVVVTSSAAGTIPMSFTVGDLRRGEVLVRQHSYRDPEEFAERAQGSC